MFLGSILIMHPRGEELSYPSCNSHDRKAKQCGDQHQETELYANAYPHSESLLMRPPHLGGRDRVRSTPI
jgi:hypothetical protein